MKQRMLSKFWLGIMTAIISVFLMVWIFQVFLLESFYVSQRKSTIENEAKKISSMINQKESQERINDEITDFTSSFNSSVLFLDKNMKIDTFPSVRSTRRSIRNEGIIKHISPYIQNSLPFTIARTRIPSGEDIMSIITGTPLSPSQGNYKYLLIISPLEPIRETASILRKQLTYISLISVIIGSIITFFLANMFTKPILKINKASKMIAAGNYDITVSVKSKDEIGMLADTINHMAYQLKQIDRFKKEFIANMSHELKTPISSIKAYGELLLDSKDFEESDKEKYASIIIENSNKLTMMVEDILDLSEMQSGNYNLDKSQFSLLKSIEKVISYIDVYAKVKNIKVALYTNIKNDLITADQEKMNSVFLNLLTNAIRHSKERNEILVQILDNVGYIHIDIIDYGEGIAPEDLPYIWERFYKADKSRKNNKSGTGLGMAIVKSILELHQFKYGIDSEIGVGTTVWLEIPK